MTFYAGRRAPEGWFTYLPDIDGINVNSRNAVDIGNGLHVTIEHDSLDPVDIDLFITRCTQFLRAHVGRPDRAMAPIGDRGAKGCRWIEFGRAEGYLQNRIADLLAMARAGQAKGATHIYGG